MPKKKQEAEALVPKHTEVDAFIAEVRTDAEKALEFIRAVQIQKAADREFAANALKEVAARHDMIDAKRKKWVEPLKAVTSDIDATFRPVTKLLKEAIDVLKTKIGAWDVEQAYERERLLRETSEALKRGEADQALLAYAEAGEIQQAGGSKIVWTGEVVDPAAIPREYLCPDVAKLEALTRAAGADPGIPGWRAYAKAEIRTSRKGAA